MTTYQFESLSSPGTKHTVKVDGERITCTCRGFRIPRSTGNTCKHVNEVRRLLAKDGGADQLAQRTAAQAQASGHEGFVAPMLAQSLEDAVPRRDDELYTTYVRRALASSTFEGQWWMEEKFDGHRVVVAVNGDVKAWSRPGPSGIALPRELPPHIKVVMRDFPGGTYDGELMVPGQNSWNVTELQKQHALVLVLFDVIRVEGKDLRGSPNGERRAYLEAFKSVLEAKGVTAVRVAEAMPVSYAGVRAIWRQPNGEGVILKHRDGLYLAGARPAHWLKVKKVEVESGAVTGFEAGKLGAHSVVVLRMPSDGAEVKVKTLNSDWLREFDRNGRKYIGRTLRIEHRGRFVTRGVPSRRHPMFDRFMDEGGAK